MGFNTIGVNSGKKNRFFSKRQNGGGNVMVWNAFYRHGKSEITILKGTKRAENYIETLENYLLPFFDRFPEEKFIFQQDNASVHT